MANAQGELLGKLDGVAWEKLAHAYGKASDIPDHLRAFASGDAAAREASARALAACLCHQGTLYPATVEAVPFLFELALSATTPDRHVLLRLLASIATCDDDRALLLGGIREPEKWPKKRSVFMNSFLAVRDGARGALPLLHDDDANVQAAASYLFAWLELHASLSAPELAAQLAKETRPSLRATLGLALGFTAGYLETDAYDGAFRAMTGDADALVRAAGALALSTAHQGEVDESTIAVITEAARGRRLSPDIPFCQGDLAAFAVRVLAAISGNDPARAERLLEVVESGTESAATVAANVVLRNLFEPTETEREDTTHDARPTTTRRRDALVEAALGELRITPAALSAPQTRLLRAIAARNEPWDGDLVEGLREGGLPHTREMLARFFGAPRPPSPLDARIQVGDATVTLNDALVEAADAAPAERAPKARAIAAALSPEDRVTVAIAAYVELEGGAMFDVGCELIAAAVPDAEPTLLALADRFTREGPPRASDLNGNEIRFDPVLPLVGIGLAATALAKGEVAPPVVDALLQATYGFDPRVRDSLRALPPERRDAWLLDPKRDDLAQPAEHFTGAWAYWAPYPSEAITARVITHVATWKPKDRWGGSRAKHADPLLASYVASLRAAGQHEDAARCEAARAPS